MIDKIIQDRRPCASLIKLIESVGTLLNVPKSKKKSAYKAPIPSNYDATLQVLLEDFYGAVVKLSQLKSSDLDNITATDFYNKMLEPGFSYEEAVNSGGLLTRELFNCVTLVLLQLQSDPNRCPVYTHNVLVLVDGNRAGHVALDSASYLCRHGTVHIVASSQHLTNGGGNSNVDKSMVHLKDDIHRRCKSHYKLLDHCFHIHDAHQILHNPSSSATPSGNQGSEEDELAAGVNALELYDTDGNGLHPDRDVIRVIRKVIRDNQCQAIVVGLPQPERYECMETMGSLPYWATWTYPGDAIFVKGMSYVRPFTTVSTPRTFIVYLDPLQQDMESTFLKSLRYFRPGDVMIALAVFPTRDPVGDNRELRFDFGSRHSWLQTEEELNAAPSHTGWNDANVESFTKKVEELMEKSFLRASGDANSASGMFATRNPAFSMPSSRVRIEREQKGVSLGDILARVSFEEKAMAVMLRLSQTKEMVIQSIRDTPTAVIVLK